MLIIQLSTANAAAIWPCVLLTWFKPECVPTCFHICVWVWVCVCYHIPHCHSWSFPYIACPLPRGTICCLIADEKWGASVRHRHQYTQRNTNASLRDTVVVVVAAVIYIFLLAIVIGHMTSLSLFALAVGWQLGGCLLQDHVAGLCHSAF